MSRYWIEVKVVKVGVSDLDVPDEEAEMTKVLLLEGFEYKPDQSGLLFKTEDKVEMERIKKTIEEELSKTEWGKSFSFEEIASIVTQPECPKCGMYGRFSDSYCNYCGAELDPKEYIY